MTEPGTNRAELTPEKAGQEGLRDYEVRNKNRDTIPEQRDRRIDSRGEERGWA